MAAPHVVVVGGGISGLAAAHALRRARPDIAITVLESTDRIGGKLHRGEVAGVQVDLGAESLLARRPEAVALARAVGLGDDIVHPATAAARMWTRGALRPLPAGQVMGVPGDLRALARSGVLSVRGLARVPLDRVRPGAALTEDVAIGRYVEARLGAEVVDRLVEPLLGGVYAGRARELSFAATVPQLFARACESSSLLAAVDAVRTTGPAASGPVFAGIRRGVGRLPVAVADAARARVRTGATVRELTRTVDGGFRLVLGPTNDVEVMAADAVVLAVPAAPAARLLADTAPAASAELATIEYASSALVTFAFPRHAAPAASGFLVPPVDGRAIKAATFSSQKWAWLDEHPDTVFVRGSVGRHGDEVDLQVDDDEIAARVLADLRAATGADLRPIDQLVTRWGGGLPQYAVGHLDRVRRIRAAVASVPSLAVCGAQFDGVGVAACVAAAGLAADRVAASLPVAGQ